MRCIPVLMKHYERTEATPELITLGFAAYLFFMKSTIKKGDQYYGELDGQSYLIQDDQAEIFYKRWTGLSTPALVQETLRDVGFWGTDLTPLPGFSQAVTDKLNLIIANGIKEAIETTQSKKVFAA